MANENETVDNVCEEMRNDWAQLYFSEGTSKRNGEHSDVAVIETEKLANRILCAHKREIADFQRRYDECVRKFNEADLERVSLRDEVVSLRALVKELAVALEKIDDMYDSYMCKFFTSTKHCSICKYLEKCQTGIAHNALKDNEREIAKAREVAK